MPQRRDFLKTAMLLGMAPLVRAKGETAPMKIKKPKRLRPGQTVGLIAPASNANENEDIRYCMDVVSSLGFKVKPGKHLYKRLAYLAGTDEERAEDVNAMFADDEVDAMITLRGGFGTPRILPLLDYELIAKNPKALIGYSDITALHNAIFKHAGVITYHGPIAYQTFSPYTLAEFKKVMMHPEETMVVGSPPPFEESEGVVERENRLTPIVDGVARGRLIGGNLSLITKLIGTPYEPVFKDNILVLEEVSEKPYKVDGMLSHLWLSGRLHELAGVVIGKFTDCEADGTSFSLEEIFTRRFAPLGKPTLRGLMIGHVSDQTTLPIGARAELNVGAGTLTLLEPAVS